MNVTLEHFTIWADKYADRKSSMYSPDNVAQFNGRIFKSDGTLKSGSVKSGPRFVSSLDDKPGVLGALRRKDDVKAANDAVRESFLKAIESELGITRDKFSAPLLDALRFTKDFGKGRPLTARRVMIVVKAVRSIASSAPKAAADAKATSETKPKSSTDPKPIADPKTEPKKTDPKPNDVPKSDPKPNDVPKSEQKKVFKGLPSASHGQVNGQTVGSNTCFTWSVVNAMNQNPDLKKHFDSLLDRENGTITLVDPTDGRKAFSLSETFNLPKDVSEKIDKKTDSDFERFVMRFCYAKDPVYKSEFDRCLKTDCLPFGNDCFMARAFGLSESHSVVRIFSDEDFGGVDVDGKTKLDEAKKTIKEQLDSGNIVVINDRSIHFKSIVGINGDDLVVADSSGGKMLSLNLSSLLCHAPDPNAGSSLSGVESLVTLSFYTRPSDKTIDEVKGELGKTDLDAFKRFVEVKVADQTKVINEARSKLAQSLGEQDWIQSEDLELLRNKRLEYKSSGNDALYNLVDELSTALQYETKYKGAMDKLASLKDGNEFDAIKSSFVKRLETTQEGTDIQVEYEGRGKLPLPGIAQLEYVREQLLDFIGAAKS